MPAFCSVSRVRSLCGERVGHQQVLPSLQADGVMFRYPHRAREGDSAGACGHSLPSGSGTPAGVAIAEVVEGSGLRELNGR